MNKRIREKKTKQSIIRSIDQDGIFLYTDKDQLNGIIRTRGHEAKRKPFTVLTNLEPIDTGSCGENTTEFRYAELGIFDLPSTTRYPFLGVNAHE